MFQPVILCCLLGLHYMLNYKTERNSSKEQKKSHAHEISTTMHGHAEKKSMAKYSIYIPTRKLNSLWKN